VELPARTDCENAPGCPSSGLTFCEPDENRPVGTDSTLPFQPVQDSRLGVICSRFKHFPVSVSFIGKLRAPFLKEKLRSHPRSGYTYRESALAAVALLDKVVNQLAGRVVHLHVEGFHLAGEIVEGHNRGDGHEQAESRGHEGLRDTAGDRADT
jgi:hypothetical protein